MNNSIVPLSGDSRQPQLPFEVSEPHDPELFAFEGHLFPITTGWNGERLISYCEACRHFDNFEVPYKGQYIQSDDEIFLGELIPSEFQELKHGMYLTLNGFYRLAVCHVIDRTKSHDAGVAFGMMFDSWIRTQNSLADRMKAVPSNYNEGWIYVVRCRNLHKIGYTRKSPEARLQSMQTGNAQKMSLLLKVYVRECEHAESVLHHKFASKLVRGEWFALDSADLAYVESLAKQFIQPGGAK